jgi:hypothetical protein
MTFPTRFCHIDDVKSYGNVAEHYSESDGLILESIRAATQLIKSVTRRSFDFAKHTVLIPVPPSKVRGSYRLFLPVVPYREVANHPIVKAVNYPNDSVKVTISPDSFLVIPENNRLDVFYDNEHEKAFFEVAYYGGLEASVVDLDVYEAPSDLRIACAVQSAYMFSRIVNETIGVKNVSVKSGTKAFSALHSGLVPEARQYIAGYVRALTAS